MVRNNRNCNKLNKELTVKLNPSGGVSYQESSESNISECEIPGFIGHFKGTGSGSSKSASFRDSPSSISRGCGNMIIPASDTGNQNKENVQIAKNLHVVSHLKPKR